MTKRKSNIEFITECNSVHHNRYDYTVVEYTNNKTNVKIICTVHGIFEQSPQAHLKGQGCPYCANRKNTHDLFVQKARTVHGDKYNYNDKYVKNNILINIICPIHGHFKQRPNRHLMGDGCPKCSDTKYTNSEFLIIANQIHYNKYKYLSKYYNMKTKIKIQCPVHGIFEQSPHNHIYQQNGCPSCRQSKSEKYISEFLKERGIIFTYQKKFKDCRNKRPLPFDFFIKDLNLCIEYDGKHHFEKIYSHEDLIYRQLNDSIKNDFCKKNNIYLLRISYKENLMQKLIEFVHGQTYFK